MPFVKPLPVWKNPGIEPNQNLIDDGWQPEQSPAPDNFNSLHHKTYEALKELQEKAAHKDEVSDQPLQDHIKNPTPHQFVDGTKRYAYGWKLNSNKDGLVFVYNEVTP